MLNLRQGRLLLVASRKWKFYHFPIFRIFFTPPCDPFLQTFTLHFLYVFASLVGIFCNQEFPIITLTRLSYFFPNTRCSTFYRVEPETCRPFDEYPFELFTFLLESQNCVGPKEIFRHNVTFPSFHKKFFDVFIYKKKLWLQAFHILLILHFQP